ncbi:aldo/keto reductase [Petrotoga sp. 9PWA.NaAc.5.4]|uniref:aldo/keto reductase n=1 Tax=Petrotoga sp. 9PWA.NaAc.5.4 TaxID=1434328 RepID=UPI000CC2E772|nr:aldo/keto reductase [Petrotoga sp. 9PWA.NaAc.5.4]PNR92522.1 MocA family oxido-reductase/dehydratase [Petrotoga sp. 9PWA.NaAc.5.4]
MKYVNLGKSGLKVSEVSLGTMTFGREADEKEANKILEYYFDNGGNFIDTANVYAEGKSEEILGRALRGKRNNIVLATKVFFPTGKDFNEKGVSRNNILRAVENSLKRLQTDYIDLYQIHCWDYFTPIEETLSALDYLINKGYVRYIGISNFSGWQIEKALKVSEVNRYEKIISAQMQYSLVVRDIEMEVMPVCNAEGISLVAWGPLGGGFLSGKYKAGEKPKEGRIAVAENDWEESWDKRATEKNFKILEKLEGIAKARNKTVAQISLNWIISRNVIPILGIRTLKQIEDNMGAVGWELTQDELNELNSISEPEERYPYRFIKSANKR